MAEIVNLRLARKAKARAAAQEQAAGNRAKFGQTRSERELNRLEKDRTARGLNQAKRL